VVEYLVKDWGWTSKVVSVNGKSDCWVCWMNPATFTSVHRHTCKSVLTCLDGELLVSLQGHGDRPDDTGGTLYLERGESFTIGPGEWHQLVSSRVDFSNGRQTVFHEWYDLKDDGSDYPIERYEGVAS
jgi:hypothetical protein